MTQQVDFIPLVPLLAQAEGESWLACLREMKGEREERRTRLFGQGAFSLSLCVFFRSSRFISISFVCLFFVLFSVCVLSSLSCFVRYFWNTKKTACRLVQRDRPVPPTPRHQADDRCGQKAGKERDGGKASEGCMSFKLVGQNFWRTGLPVLTSLLKRWREEPAGARPPFFNCPTRQTPAEKSNEYGCERTKRREKKFEGSVSLSSRLMLVPICHTKREHPDGSIVWLLSPFSGGFRKDFMQSSLLPLLILDVDKSRKQKNGGEQKREEKSHADQNGHWGSPEYEKNGRPLTDRQTRTPVPLSPRGE
mmetsp:Transcript_1728/g.3551  ORF Transcript_1728/g.3551 Transcript_1728/m.3551 type:complete len:307 (+) Transcript_1728:776-1696(+)